MSTTKSKEPPKLRIYAIQAIEKLETNELDWPDFGVTNNCGYFRTREAAFNAVEQNAGDMYEDFYKYVIVEEVKEGIFPSSNIQWFFMYNPEEDRYVQIRKPKFLNHFCGFIM